MLLFNYFLWNSKLVGTYKDFLIKHLDSRETKAVLYIGTKVLEKFTRILVKKGFYWLLPVITSKLTDPLRSNINENDVPEFLEVTIYGEKATLTRSLIIHKRILVSLGYEKIFFLSPCIRLEVLEKLKTNRHSYEFTQLDFEIAYGKCRDVFKLVEEMIIETLKYIKKDVKELLDTEIRIPKKPFKIYDREDLEKDFGKNWEEKVSIEIKDPVWVINIPRQFYDLEIDGKWINYDLILPEGYGEVLSGGEREYEYEKILKKMERSGLNPENYRLLLDLAKEGLLKPSAGAGIGIERFVRWVTRRKTIYEVQPFPRIIGKIFEL